MAFKPGGRLGRAIAPACMTAMAAVLTGPAAAAQALSLDLEVVKVAANASWQTVSLENTYTIPVIVCTYNLPSDTAPSATTRIQTVTSNSFQLKIQQFENSTTVTPGDVHCIIADQGAYNSGGLKFEARTVLSDRTSGLSVPNNWNFVNQEEITGSLTQSYTSPVVLGQVMSSNDARASVFWTHNCQTRGRPPFESNGRVCVGKHIGQINSTRASETLGYIVIETGSGLINGMRFTSALGADSVTGVGNNPPYTYNVGNDYDIGVLTQAAEDGGQGGWAVLYGNNPLPANTVQMAVEEETVAGDTSRTHTTEQIGYWLFKDEQIASIDVNKTVALAADNPTPYAIPGNDVVYTLSADNTGNKTIDADSIFIVDGIPDNVTFYNGDIDGPGPLTDAVVFDAGASGLTFNSATDLGFSTSAVKPADFSACNAAPAAGYDPAVRWICFNPKGKFRAGSLAPSDFSFDFRVGID